MFSSYFCLHFGTVRQAAADLGPFLFSALTDSAALLCVELLDGQETDIAAPGHVFHGKPDTGLLTTFMSLESVEDLHFQFVFYNLIIESLVICVVLGREPNQRHRPQPQN